MADDNQRERIRQLAVEIHNLIEENFHKDPKENKEVMKQLHQIRDEIQSYGFLVAWKAEVNLENPSRVRAIVTVLEPRKNLSPEDQKIYDDLFRRLNGIKNEE